MSCVFKDNNKIYKYNNNNSLIPPIMYLNRFSAYTGNEKANLFNDYFKSVYTNSPYKLPTFDGHPNSSFIPWSYLHI